jgi:hypothetical protein
MSPCSFTVSPTEYETLAAAFTSLVPVLVLTIAPVSVRDNTEPVTVGLGLKGFSSLASSVLIVVCIPQETRCILHLVV